FGDSKVVDANGDPLVVYHGTQEEFTVFDASLSSLELTDNHVDNKTLVEINAQIRGHLVEEVGKFLRAAMSGMKAL
ncbi:MAG: hypothetical protein U9P12_06355, partial [Verrucomicrobiota bacterium]|nr:hypothetical protein [Verrucomicrobiota bacterium]